jgi:hypothetical protein
MEEPIYKITITELDGTIETRILSNKKDFKDFKDALFVSMIDGWYTSVEIKLLKEQN